MCFLSGYFIINPVTKAIWLRSVPPMIPVPQSNLLCNAIENRKIYQELLHVKPNLTAAKDHHNHVIRLVNELTVSFEEVGLRGYNF